MRWKWAWVCVGFNAVVPVACLAFAGALNLGEKLVNAWFRVDPQLLGPDIAFLFCANSSAGKHTVLGNPRFYCVLKSENRSCPVQPNPVQPSPFFIVWHLSLIHI